MAEVIYMVWLCSVCTGVCVELLGQPASHPAHHLLYGHDALTLAPNPAYCQLLNTPLASTILCVGNSACIPTSILTRDKPLGTPARDGVDQVSL